MAEGPYHRLPDEPAVPPVLRPDLPPPPAPGGDPSGFTPWEPMPVQERAWRDRRLARWSRALSGAVAVGALITLALSLGWRRPIPGVWLGIVIAFPIIFFGHGRTVAGIWRARQERWDATGTRPPWYLQSMSLEAVADGFRGLRLVEGLAIGALAVIGLVGAFTLSGSALPEPPAGAPSCESVADPVPPECRWQEDRDDVEGERLFASLFLVFSALSIGSAQATLRRTEDVLGGRPG